MTVVTGVMQGARELAAQAREQAQAARDLAREQAQLAREQAQAARDQAQAARDQARDIAQQGAPGGGSDHVVVTVNKDGHTVTIDGASPEAIYGALGMPVPGDQQNDGPFVVAGLGIVSTAIVVLASVVMWYRTRMRALHGPASPVNAELTQRMARMEAAIESVAVEVERISEGQRFTTRVLTERSPVEVPRG